MSSFAAAAVANFPGKQSKFATAILPYKFTAELLNILKLYLKGLSHGPWAGEVLCKLL